MAETVRSVFRHSGIEVSWISGALDTSEALLITYPAPPPKGREMEALCRARRDIALEVTQAPPGLKGSILGMAEPLAREGINIRVFSNRALGVALDANADYALVLAHLIAHEIGHVLLRSRGHSRWGLMSGPWTSHEYDRMRKGSMRFTDEQSRTIRSVLAGAGCPAADQPPLQVSLGPSP